MVIKDKHRLAPKNKEVKKDWVNKTAVGGWSTALGGLLGLWVLSNAKIANININHMYLIFSRIGANHKSRMKVVKIASPV